MIRMTPKGARLEMRREQRVRYSAEARIRYGGRRGSAEVNDLSPGGARLATMDQLEPGMKLWLKLPELEALQATVMWAERFDAGCSLERPLHPAVFEWIVKH